MVFHSSSGLVNLESQKMDKIHSVRNGGLLGSVSFSHNDSEDEEGPQNELLSDYDDDLLRQKKPCDGCKSRDREVEKLKFENSLLKDALENHKRTIAILE